MMKKITRDDDLSRSADLAAQNVQRLAELFPEAVVEGRVDLDVLRQLLGEHVEASSERFGLSWKGKAQARQLALKPSTGTLRPCPEESVDWKKTQNVFIEGDNLEVLKLLQKSYQGQVKLIYIDPPYNTGNDFVYPDDFRDGVQHYLQITGQYDDDGLRLSTNAESSGRYHTNWLNMMLPRLKLARELLRDDGIIFVSIDDNEAHNLRLLMDEVFGPDNFLACVAWEKRYTRSNNARTFYSLKDSILVYRRSDLLDTLREARTEKADAGYANEDNDPRGPWTTSSYVNPATKDKRPNLVYEIVAPDGRKVTHPTHAWKYSRDEHMRHVAEGRLWWGKDGDAVFPRKKIYLNDADGMVPIDVWDYKTTGTSDEGGNEVKALFDGVAVFDNPKPTRLVHRMLGLTGPESTNDIVMDFFAGSGSTGHAVMSLNSSDGGKRRFVLVQMPYPLDSDGDEQSGAVKMCKQMARPATIAEITKERLRRAGKKLRAENPMFAGDLGFRVYKLDSTNLKPWDPQPEDLERQIELAIEHVKPGRSEADLLTELLLKLGLELTVQVDTHSVAGHTVYAVGGGALLACLSPKISRTDVEDLAEGIVALHHMLKPASIEPEGASARPKPARETTTVLFRDAAFADDVAKANLSAILEQRGLHNLRSL